MGDASTSSNQLSGFARQVRDAVVWRSGSQIAAQLVQWAATFLVIRILAPADYGLYAMTGVVLAFLNMLNGYGLASSLVRQRDVTSRMIGQLFGMLIVMNVALALIQVALAPLAATYYRQPEVAGLLRVQAIAYLFTPFIALPYALLSRQMDFRKQARVNIAAAFVAAVSALGGALAGLGVWTLVLAPTMLFATRAVGMTIAARALVRPVFDFRGAGHLARYGGVMAAGQLFWFAQSQSDVFIAGRALTPHVLGIYTTSLFLTQIFVAKFVPPLNEVAFSAFARLQEDVGARAYAFTKAVRVVMAAALPFYLGLAVTAEPIVRAMLGDKWAEAIPVVRLLALAMPFMTMQVLYTPACDAVGKPSVGVVNGAMGAVLLTLAFLVGVHGGAAGLALAWLVACPLYLAIGTARALPVIGARARDVLAAVGPPLLAATAMAAAVSLIDRALPPMPPLARLGLLGATGVVAYFVLLATIARERIDELIGLVRR